MAKCIFRRHTSNLAALTQTHRVRLCLNHIASTGSGPLPSPLLGTLRQSSIVGRRECVHQPIRQLKHRPLPASSFFLLSVMHYGKMKGRKLSSWAFLTCDAKATLEHKAAGKCILTLASALQSLFKHQNKETRTRTGRARACGGGEPGG